MEIEGLKVRALQIKNEVEEGRNNANRVGGLLEGIVDGLEEVDEEIKNIPIADKEHRGFVPAVKEQGIQNASLMPIPVWTGTKVDWSILSAASEDANGLMTHQQFNDLKFAREHAIVVNEVSDITQIL